MKVLIAAIVLCATLAQGVRGYRLSSLENNSGDNDYNQNLKQGWRHERRTWDAEEELASLLAVAQPQKGGNRNVVADRGPAAINLPDATLFENKIRDRLNTSKVLSTRTEVKDKIINYANRRLNDCKTLRGNALDTQCVARVTGIIMQFIASVENLVRDLPKQ